MATWALVIGLVAAAVGLLREYLQLKPLLPMRTGRLGIMAGRWEGIVDQPNHPKGFTKSSAVLNLQTGRRRLKGTALLKPSAGTAAQYPEVKLKVRGAFFESSFVKIDYANHDPGVLQFGALLLKLDARGESLVGGFVGYGQYADGLVHGTCELHKVTDL